MMGAFPRFLARHAVARELRQRIVHVIQHHPGEFHLCRDGLLMDADVAARLILRTGRPDAINGRDAGPALASVDWCFRVTCAVWVFAADGFDCSGVNQHPDARAHVIVGLIGRERALRSPLASVAAASMVVN